MALLGAAAVSAGADTGEEEWVESSSLSGAVNERLSSGSRLVPS